MADIRINALATTATASASDDYIAIDGAANGTRKLSVYSPTFGGAATFAGAVTAPDVVLGTSGPSVKSSLNARDARQGIELNNTHGNITFPSFAVAASADFTYAEILTLRSAPSNSESPLLWDNAVGGLKVLTALTLTTSPAGVSAGALVLNEACFIVLTRVAGTLYIYRDGVVAASGADATAYDFSILRNSAYPCEGKRTPIGLLNRGLSAAEVLTLYKTGHFPAYDVVPAGQSLLGTGAKTVTAGAPTLSGSTDTSLTFVTTTGVDICSWPQNANRFGSVKKGTKFLITYNAVNNNGKVGTVSFAIARNGDINGSPNTMVPATAFIADGVTRSVEATAVLDGSNLIVGFISYAGAGLADVTVTQFAVKILGGAMIPETNAPGNGSAWNDVSGNNRNIQLATPLNGSAWAISSYAPNRIKGVTSTNGNQQLTNGANPAFTVANSHLLRIRAKSRSGTPTIFIGTTSGSAGVVAAVALSTTWKVLTIVAGQEISAGTFFWVNSTTTDLVDVEIVFEPMFTS